MKTLILFILCFWLLPAWPAVDAGELDELKERFNRSVDRQVQWMIEKTGREAPTFEELEERRQKRWEGYNEWLMEEDDYNPELDDLHEDDEDGNS